ncbi:c-type cytochrome [Corallococcus macrosporus]|uniref:Cytochrome c n=2 Tax=Myxococcaceae TaxID=31 RepID=A0A250JNM1_9BACT|nr:cytochrome c [Corallococcus macrosporus]AEI62645.1 cytochrome c family protein [Corallococcus macrosporus]ATB45455.1 cytochrome c [Corallococcus macrosporus DSM 14697]
MMKRFVLVLSLTLATGAHAETVADVWKAKCAMCHGADGKAQTKMGQKASIGDMSRPDWQKARADAELREVIAEGAPRNRMMKPFKDKLTPAQIDALVGYIRTFKAPSGP